MTETGYDGTETPRSSNQHDHYGTRILPTTGGALMLQITRNQIPIGMIRLIDESEGTWWQTIITPGLSRAPSTEPESEER